MHNHVVLNFSRMSPPTISGHGKVVDKVLSVAKDQKATHRIVLSRTQDSNKNPVSPEDKLALAKTFWPHANFETATPEHPSFIHQAKKLHGEGFHHLHVVVGSDRVDELTKKLNQYNGPGKDFNFKSIKVHSAGDRDPDDVGSAGMSATKIRLAAANHDDETLRKEYGEHAGKVKAAVRKGLKLDEDHRIGFKTFLAEETSKMTGITHLQHVSDMAAIGDHHHASNLLMGLHQHLQGKTPAGFQHSIKYDGSVAIRTRKSNGIVELSTKSGENKTPKINRTHEDIELNHGHSPGLVSTMKLVLDHAHKVLPDNGVTYQGDVMHQHDSIDHNGASTPNTLTYSPADSKTRDKVLKSRVGIAFHSKGDGNLISNLQQEGFAEHPDVHLINASHHANISHYSSADREKVSSHLQKMAETHASLHPEQRADVVQTHGEHLQTYFNKTRRSGDTPSYEGYRDHLNGQYEKAISKLTSVRGVARKTEAKSSSLAHAEANKEGINKILKVRQHAERAAQVMQNVVNKSPQGGFNTSIAGKKTPGEGSVISNGTSQAKIVPQGFTAANAANIRLKSRT